MKAYDESYSKIIRGHKYKDKDNDKDNNKDKDTDKVPEIPSLSYIFEILKLKFSFPRSDLPHIRLKSRDASPFKKFSSSRSDLPNIRFGGRDSKSCFSLIFFTFSICNKKSDGEGHENILHKLFSVHFYSLN